MKYVIETSSLKIGYSHKHPLHEALNLQLEEGRLTSLLGLNGAGKSTLLRTLCGFLPPLGGSLSLLGRPLDDYSQSELSTVIGVVLTDRVNAGGVTVRELASLGRFPYTGFFGRLSANDLRITDEALEAAGMLHKADCCVAELSDGERQKVMIAKALAQQCPVIVLDEPTAFLDVTSRMETIALLRRLAAEQNKTVLMSTHDLDMAIQMSDCLWLLSREKPLAAGTPEDLILCGAFSSFFQHDNISFDVSTGKLVAARSLRPVAVEGDFNTAYWVGNALLRNGFQPVAPSAVTDVNLTSQAITPLCHIKCHSPNSIYIQFHAVPPQTATSIAHLLSLLRSAELVP
jgi:iron complex transport system ATP-binding protein